MFLTETGSAMASLLSDFGSIATAIFTQVQAVATTIVGSPLMLFTTGFLFLGGCVGIFSRILRK